MRPAAAAPLGQPRQYTSQDERDLMLEQRYVYEREGFPSTLALVSVKAEELAVQFFEWRCRQAFPSPIPDALLEYERMRFGCELYPAAHGVLWFQVRCQLEPKAGGRVMPRVERAGVPVAPTEAAGRKLAREKAMPALNLSEAEYERRQAELLEQRRRLGIEREPGAEG
jgi:hypothetical protein